MGSMKVWDGIAWQVAAQQGPAGPTTMPVGGSAGQALVKVSGTDFDVAWQTPWTLADGANIVFGTTTGTKFGTSATQKMAWWNATPVVQNTGWSVTAGYTADKAFNPESTTVTEIARVLGTLIDTLKTYGIVG